MARPGARRRAGATLLGFATLLLASVLVLLPAVPAGASHGPSGGLVWCGQVPIVDTLAGTLRPDRLLVWRDARDRALRMWERAGVLTFDLTEVDPAAYPAIGPSVDDIPAGMIPGTIRLARNVLGKDASWGYHGFWATYPSGQGALVALWPWAPLFRADGRRQLVGVIAQEVGHALGLNHRPGGVMGGGVRPDAHDLEAVRDFYAGCSNGEA